MPTHSAAQEGTPSPASARRSRDLPDPIHEAHLRLTELTRRGGELAGLSARGQDVLYEYLSKTDLRSTDAAGRMRVFDTSSRELERATDYSRSSITGANRDLVAAGLIERPPQEMAGARRPGTPVGQTFLTPYGAALFFGPRAQNIAQPVDKEPNPIGGEGATPRAPVEKVPEAQQPAAPAPAADGQPFHVRDDLKPLLQVLQPVQLRKVLRIARREGVWVQHIMAHRLPAILAAHDPQALLIHLIHAPEDWTRAVAPPKKPKATEVSIKSANTLAGEREDEERRRKEAEDDALKAKPRAEHLAAIAALKHGARLRAQQGGSTSGRSCAGA
jgi:hypothetical protein